VLNLFLELEAWGLDVGIFDIYRCDYFLVDDRFFLLIDYVL
jgi:hypothetical protein